MLPSEKGRARRRNVAAEMAEMLGHPRDHCRTIGWQRSKQLHQEPVEVDRSESSFSVDMTSGAEKPWTTVDIKMTITVTDQIVASSS